MRTCTESATYILIPSSIAGSQVYNGDTLHLTAARPQEYLLGVVGTYYWRVYPCGTATYQPRGRLLAISVSVLI